jgi:hypothetical protein
MTNLKDWLHSLSGLCPNGPDTRLRESTFELLGHNLNQRIVAGPIPWELHDALAIGS